MPEGHLIHRYAAEHHALLAGRRVSASSPQGRIDVRPVDGHVVTAVQALGKHLLYVADSGLAVHVHLGMRGVFLRQDDPQVPPRKGTRLRLATDEAAVDLIAPIVCETLDADRQQALRASLGPDPLDPHADPVAAARRLSGHAAPVGVAVLDQSVWSGIGNAWRAELLFLAGLHPRSRVDVEAARHLWDLAVRHLDLGRDAGQVVSDPDSPDERWVYKREACRRCGSPVETGQLAGRTTYVCPVDQREPER